VHLPLDANAGDQSKFLPNVTVVFPCLDEELAIESCVKRALRAINTDQLRGQVIVVDNGSKDRSVELAMAAGAHVIHQPEPGYGAALRSGFDSVTTDYVVMADADGTYELEAIPRLIIPLLNGTADLVLGARLSDASTATMPWLHRFVGTPVISRLVNRAAGGKISVRDSQTGFRVFRKRDIDKLHFTSTGMEFASEMLIKFAWAGYTIVESDTSYAERIGESKLNTFSDGLRHLRQILLLSPQAFATIPGLTMILAAIGLWLTASGSTQGLGRVGTLSWLANQAAGVLSIIGPITLSAGLVLRYRSESTGLRHEHVALSLERLVTRFRWVGVSLILISISTIGFLVFGRHDAAFKLDLSTSNALASFTRSGLVDGIILLALTTFAPLLSRPPRVQLPAPDIEVFRPNASGLGA
jgi:glycosyltransferase involved in cell wall biosynthesis